MHEQSGGKMVQGVNINDELNNTQDSQLNAVSGVVTNPITNPYANKDKHLLIDETALSDEAVNLYQKEQDVKQFTNLAMSDPEDLSHEQIISNLFNKGVTDLFSEDTFSELAQNQKLLNDLEL